FELPEMRLAVHLEDHRQAHAGLLRDERVELHERNAELLRSERAERALPRAAQADERDDAVRWRRDARGIEERRWSGAERLGDVEQTCDRDVSFPRFELNEKSRAHARRFRELLEREVPRVSRTTHRGAEPREKRFTPFRILMRLRQDVR